MSIILPGKYSPLHVESPAEIYADKIVATLSRMDRRGSIKPTDLFDLEYLADTFGAVASREQIIKKASAYGENSLVSDGLIKRVIAYVRDSSNHPAFRDDLGKTLLPDVFRNMRFDQSYFDRTTRHFMQYLSEA